ncbi:MAG: cytochrome b/b6 domain-containing protein [bacterium]|nr:cytochrome b/b6 domain-containing protein [bacterium]
MKMEYVYRSYERFWHWMQAILIIFLGMTGFEIHGTFGFFGFEQAVQYHNIAAILFIVLIVFTIFWHITTGEWKQYLPTRQNLRKQAEYYLVGIFHNAPHPTRKTKISKLNPLQKIVYLALKIQVLPVMVLSGLLFMFYRYPQQHEVVTLSIQSLSFIALAHVAGAYFLVAFFIAHIYLMTTGHTITSNLRAMITGFEELPNEDTEPTVENSTSVNQVK